MKNGFMMVIRVIGIRVYLGKEYMFYYDSENAIIHKQCSLKIDE